MICREKSAVLPKQRSRTSRLTKILLGILLLILLALLVGLLDNRLVFATYTVVTEKVTEPVRFVMLSDLHSRIYGEDQEDLLRMIDEAEPDVIFLVGDISDTWETRDTAGDLLRGITERYPCFCVTGNHEYWSGRSEDILAYYESFGVQILEGTSATLEVNGQTIRVCGITDADAPWYSDMTLSSEAQLDSLAQVTTNGNFSLLLAHRPELFELYTTYGYDLVLSGHAHGGQWRIPGLINGVAAPSQGWFPRYAGGWYEENNTVMIVGRGLANNAGLIPRFFNPPEVVVVDIIPEGQAGGPKGE